MKLVVEPTGCLAAAAVLDKCLAIQPGMRIGVVVSGGNVDLTRYGQLLAGSINES
jgi:threonine dehydratase